MDSIDFLEIGGYVAKESVNDVAIGGNLSHEQRAEFMDLANEFQSLFTEAPGTTSLAQHHIKLTVQPKNNARARSGARSSSAARTRKWLKEVKLRFFRKKFQTQGVQNPIRKKTQEVTSPTANRK